MYSFPCFCFPRCNWRSVLAQAPGLPHVLEASWCLLAMSLLYCLQQKHGNKWKSLENWVGFLNANVFSFLKKGIQWKASAACSCFYYLNWEGILLEKKQLNLWKSKYFVLIFNHLFINHWACVCLGHGLSSLCFLNYKVTAEIRAVVVVTVNMSGNLLEDSIVNVAY